MATVKFDMTDPETKATVDGWGDNEEYVIKTGAGANRATATTVEPEEEEPAEEEEPEEVPAEEAEPGPAAVKAAMGG